MRLQRAYRLRRRALASLETVLALLITLPVLIVLLYIGFQACRRLYQVIATLVGWPYL